MWTVRDTKEEEVLKWIVSAFLADAFGFII